MTIVPAAASPAFSPLYRQIKTLLLQSLETGEWRPGEAIPSEADLAVRFGVSQGTVRKAIDELATDNLVVRRQGKGTFVATHDDPRAFFRFLRLVPLAGGREPSKSIPLECWRAKAGPESARMLGLSIGDAIVILRRLLQFAAAGVAEAIAAIEPLARDRDQAVAASCGRALAILKRGAR